MTSERERRLVVLSASDIISITPGGILYHDRSRAVGWVDFKECNVNWRRSRDVLSLWDMQCVGWRNTGEGRVLDVELFTEPRTRFEFYSYEQRDTSLLNPMRECGWYTWDASSNNEEESTEINGTPPETESI